MKKYIKHYIESALFKYDADEFFFEEDEVDARDDEFLNNYFFDEKLIKEIIENKYTSKRYMARYPDIITDGRPLAKIRFYDINYIIDGDLIYKSEKTNYSSWICFGSRTLKSDRKQNYCLTNHGQFPMKKDDLTYEEFIQIYLNQTKKTNKVKKLEKKYWQVYKNHL